MSVGENVVSWEQDFRRETKQTQLNKWQQSRNRTQAAIEQEVKRQLGNQLDKRDAIKEKSFILLLLILLSVSNAFFYSFHFFLLYLSSNSFFYLLYYTFFISYSLGVFFL